jgi:hypothetical protein
MVGHSASAAWSETQQIAGDTRGLGRGIAIDGNTLVATCGRLLNGKWTGVVDIYERNTPEAQWQLKSTIEQTFGGSSHHVALSGDFLVVGSSFERFANIQDAGSAYVYRRLHGQWKFQQKLIETEPRPFHQFGNTVACHNGVIAVSAVPRAAGQFTPNGADPGSVTIYRFNGTKWLPGAVLKAGDSSRGDAFGSLLALNDDGLAVARYSESVTKGVYIYRYDSTQKVWTEEIRFSTTSPGPRGLSYSGSRVAIVQRGGPQGLNIVQVFARGIHQWYEEAQLSETNPPYLLSDVAIVGDTIAVGAIQDKLGRVVLYRRGVGDATWRRLEYVTSHDIAVDDYFGFYIALSGDTLVVGAEQYSKGGPSPRPGALYSYHERRD